MGKEKEQENKVVEEETKQEKEAEVVEEESKEQENKVAKSNDDEDVKSQLKAIKAQLKTYQDKEKEAEDKKLLEEKNYQELITKKEKEIENLAKKLQEKEVEAIIKKAKVNDEIVDLILPSLLSKIDLTRDIEKQTQTLIESLRKEKPTLFMNNIVIEKTKRENKQEENADEIFNNILKKQ